MSDYKTKIVPEVVADGFIAFIAAGVTEKFFQHMLDFLFGYVENKQPVRYIFKQNLLADVLLEYTLPDKPNTEDDQDTFLDLFAMLDSKAKAEIIAAIVRGSTYEKLRYAFSYAEDQMND